MEVKVGRESGIELKAREDGGLCYAFLLLKDYTECFFLLFLFGVWNM